MTTAKLLQRVNIFETIFRLARPALFRITKLQNETTTLCKGECCNTFTKTGEQRISSSFHLKLI